MLVEISINHIIITGITGSGQTYPGITAPKLLITNI